MEYEALEKVLRLINNRYKGCDIGLPILGWSKYEGKGEKNRILNLIEGCLTDVNATLYMSKELTKKEIKHHIWVHEKNRAFIKDVRKVTRKGVQERRKRDDKAFKFD